MKKLLLLLCLIANVAIAQTQIVPRQISFSGQSGFFLKKTDWDMLMKERTNLQQEIARLKNDTHQSPSNQIQSNQVLMCKIDNLSCEKELEFIKRTLEASLNNIQDSNMRETLRLIVEFNKPKKE